MFQIVVFIVRQILIGASFLKSFNVLNSVPAVNILLVGPMASFNLCYFGPVCPGHQ